jgi:AcrR family transcriptional regulator
MSKIIEKMPEKKRLRNTANPQKILEAALDLMSIHGYAGTSISMISDLSGYPVTSIYWHFGNKEKLLLAALEYGAIEILDTKHEFQSRNLRNVDQHIALIDPETLLNPPKVWRMMFLISLESDGENENIQRVVTHIRQHARNILQQHIQALAVSQSTLLSTEIIKAIADFAMAIGDGFIMANQLEPGNVDINLGYQMQIKAISQLIKEYGNEKYL